MKERKASQTAEGTAAVRARESLRPPEERICYDPFARYFLSPKYLLFGIIKPLGDFIRWRNEKILPGMFGGVVARTRYIDDYLKDCLNDGLEQLVILGAGFDSRAYVRRWAEATRRL